MDFWGRMALRALGKAPKLRLADPIYHGLRAIGHHRREDQSSSSRTTRTLHAGTDEKVTSSGRDASFIPPTQQVHPDVSGETENLAKDQVSTSLRAAEPLVPPAPDISAEAGEPVPAPGFPSPAAMRLPVADAAVHEFGGEETADPGPPRSEIQDAPVSPLPISVSRKVRPGMASQTPSLIQSVEPLSPPAQDISGETGEPVPAPGIPGPATGNPPEAVPAVHDFKGVELPATGAPRSEIHDVPVSPLPTSDSRKLQPGVAGQTSSIIQSVEPLGPLVPDNSGEAGEPVPAPGIPSPAAGKPRVADSAVHEFKGEETLGTGAPSAVNQNPPLFALPNAASQATKPKTDDLVPGSLTGQSVAETGIPDYPFPRTRDIAAQSKEVQPTLSEVPPSKSDSFASPHSQLNDQGDMDGVGPSRKEIHVEKNQAVPEAEADQKSVSSARQAKESNSSAPFSKSESISGQAVKMRQPVGERTTEYEGLSETIKSAGKQDKHGLHNPIRPLLDAESGETNPMVHRILIPTKPPVQVAATRASLPPPIAATAAQKQAEANGKGRTAIPLPEQDDIRTRQAKTFDPVMAAGKEKDGLPSASPPPSSIVDDRGAATQKLVSFAHDERSFVAEALTREPGRVHDWNRSREGPQESSSIEVVIDSIEIVSQAVQPSTEPVASYEPAAPPLSLDGYLQQRNEGTL